MSDLPVDKKDDGVELQLSSLRILSPSTHELSNSSENSVTDDAKAVQAVPDTTRSTPSSHNEPKASGLLGSKFHGSKRTKVTMISTFAVILTVSVALLPAILFVDVAV